jgi:hypothetical protein
MADWLGEGSVYMSSPACFMHGVQYDRALLWGNRIIALQCRFPVDPEDMQLLRGQSNGNDFTALMQCIEACLRDKPLVMPLLSELVAIEGELALLE